MPYHPPGRIVYALEYWFEVPPPASRHLIVWLDENGYSERPEVFRLDRRPIVYTKPGETLSVFGEEWVVKSVKAYRESAVP